MEQVQLVAPSDTPVLILGETGSGKEVVARAIHSRSRRASGPFLRINCGAISPDLVDSELFGHERGSFTGAVAERKGWFERADCGTLFLDECGELPLPAQVRLLRVLQDGTFQRVGGERPMHVDVRVVAATHRDLPAMVASGQFREDLWYRIAVFPVRLPPLRERLTDIPALATHFALRAAKRLGLNASESLGRRHPTARLVYLAGQRARAIGGDRARGHPRRRQATRRGTRPRGRRGALASLRRQARKLPIALADPCRGLAVRAVVSEPGRRHGPAHRSRAGANTRPRRGTGRGGGHPPDQPPYTAVAHPQARNRLATGTRAARSRTHPSRIMIRTG